ncbi:hypothetical protein [Parafannyhessea umbonata]|uniref:Uncharacterized protein n=1 Tax=Parafannyhessea umbonata TaxID=604330 RepID=A0A1H1KYF3_9ACTN|nr:hypothetical protein [Parafannyhessea umbonata]SDR66709.1 hypothetical protein SAMN04489857_0447 [Parafannyhessea umbonata]
MAFDQQGRQGDQTVSQGRTSVYGTRQTGQSQGASQYTRQYQTHQPYGRVQAQSGQASQDADEPQKRGVLSEFSGSAVIASALAAVTSFALQSKIGLAGSIIGVGVAAAATTIASQVYKGMLSASAQKLKDLSDQAPTTNGAYGATRDLRASSGTTQAWAKPVSLDDAASEAGVADSGTPIAPQSVRDAAQSRKGALVRKRMAIVMAVAAVAAVLVYALIVNLATSGQGIGSTEPIVATSSQSQDDQQSQDDGAAKGKGTKSQQTKGTADGSKQDGKSSGTPSGTTDGAKDSSGTTTDGTSGNASSGTSGTASGGNASGTSNSGTGDSGTGTSGTTSGNTGTNGNSGATGDSDAGTTDSKGTSGTTTSGTSGATGATTTTTGGN